MTLQEFYDALASFDWYYEMSDDHSVWTAGVRRSDELRAIAKQSPEHQALYEAWGKHMYTGPAWENERAPKPERPA